MALDRPELLVTAGEREREKSVGIDMNPEAVSVLDGVLCGVCDALRPKREDYDNRSRLVAAAHEMVKEVFGKSSNPPSVQPFGSFIMDLFTATSDLDLSINFSHSSVSSLSRDEKIGILRRMVKLLMSHQRQGRIRDVTPILKARVPIVKFVDRRSEVECDMSVENKDGVLKSYIIFLFSSIDERCQVLSRLMKAWAKAQGINSSRDNTLSSIAVILLVIFHLQTRDPPILPPLSAVLEGGTEVGKLQGAVHRFKSFGRKNTETIAELFISLLNKLFSVRFWWKQGLCASTYEGSWIPKRWGSGNSCISVEDFTDREQNCARAVNEKQFFIIHYRIQQTLTQLGSFMKNAVPAPKLQKLLFGPMGLHTGETVNPISNKKTKKRIKKIVKKKVGPQSQRPISLGSAKSKVTALKKGNNSWQPGVSSVDGEIGIGNADRGLKVPIPPQVPATKINVAANGSQEQVGSGATGNQIIRDAVGLHREAAPSQVRVGTGPKRSHPPASASGPPAKKAFQTTQPKEAITSWPALNSERPLPPVPGAKVHLIQQTSSMLSFPSMPVPPNRPPYPLEPSGHLYISPRHSSLQVPGVSLPSRRPDYGPQNLVQHFQQPAQVSVPQALQQSINLAPGGLHNLSVLRAPSQSIKPSGHGLHNPVMPKQFHHQHPPTISATCAPQNVNQVRIPTLHTHHRSIKPSIHGFHDPVVPVQFHRQHPPTVPSLRTPQDVNQVRIAALQTSQNIHHQASYDFVGPQTRQTGSHFAYL